MKAILIFFSFYQCIIAQNYLYNPGFEPIQSEFEKEYPKSDPRDFKYAKGCRCCLQSWRINYCNSGLPYWNKRLAASGEIYDNPLNTQINHPRKIFGKSYAWIYITGYDEEGKLKLLNPQSTYLETKLKRPLLKGKKYNVSIQIAQGRSFANLAINHFGILFTEDPMNIDTISLIDLSPQIEMESILDTTSRDYSLFQETFVANKDYHYLTLGFFPNGKSPFKQYLLQDITDPGFDVTEWKKHPSVSFQIDELQIVEMMDNDKFQKEISDKINIKNIQFETGKAILTSVGQTEIDKLVKLLEELPNLKVKIEGHTDDEGAADYNMDLSNKRANEILSYIHKKGIGLDRMEAKGYGETMPLVLNTSTENREVNRRVEIKVLN